MKCYPLTVIESLLSMAIGLPLIALFWSIAFIIGAIAIVMGFGILAVLVVWSMAQFAAECLMPILGLKYK